MTAEIHVGHWTDAKARTGCTVVLFSEGVTASAEVRGGAPASRELALLAPERTVARIDAVLLTGGSAFGLAAAHGVMRWCEERGRGVPTPAGSVPIVPTLGLFDLAVGDSTVRPGPEAGYAACQAARAAPFSFGVVGAGAGATVGAVRGPANARSGGLVIAAVEVQDLKVQAVVAVNAYGAIDADGSQTQSMIDIATPQGFADARPLANTVIGVVVTNARLDKVGCLVAAQGAHDGLARAVTPPHTRFDGDAFVAAATGEVAADVDVVRLLAVEAVERAIRSTPDIAEHSTVGGD